MAKQRIPATLHNISKQEIQANLPCTTSAKQEGQAKQEVQAKLEVQAKQEVQAQQEVQAKVPAATEGRSVQRRRRGWQRWRVARRRQQQQQAAHEVHCSELLHWPAAGCHT